MIILLNKPYDVLCQFTDSDNRKTLAHYITKKNVYAAGRLDKDSEGLVILTDDGKLQNRIADPRHKMKKTYWAQVEGVIDQSAIDQLANGVMLKDGMTKQASVKIIEEPGGIWPRNPPIRQRMKIPTSWIELIITEGRNRQVRRMTAAVNFPTLRLIRSQVGQWGISKLQPGECLIINSPEF